MFPGHEPCAHSTTGFFVGGAEEDDIGLQGYAFAFKREHGHEFHDAQALHIECAAPPDRLARFQFSDVRRHLARLKFISSERAIDVVHRLDIPHAYPIPMLGLAGWRDDLIRRLRRRGVGLLGRFGAWRYVAVSDVIVESKEMAERM